MKRAKPDPAVQPFVDRVREAELRLFPDAMHDEEAAMMKSAERRFWHFRPSHHAATGLITEADVVLLAQPGRRLLSVGAAPAFLERLLPELGVPAAHIVVTDNDPSILESARPPEAYAFDAHETWPDMGTFDVILFPESLCLSVGETIKARGLLPDIPDRTAMLKARDLIETDLLITLLRQAFARLRPGGVIRANGPQSHPSVNDAVSAALMEEYPHALEQRRYFLSMRRIVAA